ncbi:MAG: hypothetical protein Q7I98_00740, partial [Erysipelotrichaceae bacterium]|nr:hypothetical protein [Erysipelotrichaceae bacterium]
MDWKRSKNILILALLVTNIVLFILSGAADKLFKPQSEEDPLLDPVVSMLGQRGIKNAAVLPSNIKSIQAIDLEYNEV